LLRLLGHLLLRVGLWRLSAFFLLLGLLCGENGRRQCSMKPLGELVAIGQSWALATDRQPAAPCPAAPA
jgi:hypothetical protein